MKIDNEMRRQISKGHIFAESSSNRLNQTNQTCILDMGQFYLIVGIEFDCKMIEHVM
jgi:hypothetical protein